MSTRLLSASLLSLALSACVITKRDPVGGSDVNATGSSGGTSSTSGASDSNGSNGSGNSTGAKDGGTGEGEPGNSSASGSNGGSSVSNGAGGSSRSEGSSGSEVETGGSSGSEGGTGGGSESDGSTGSKGTDTSGPQVPKAPVAERRPHVVRSPHGDRSDPYYWLRDDNEGGRAIKAYLDAENKYKDLMMEPYKALEKTIYQEMVDRVELNYDTSAEKEGNYGYFLRYSEKMEYPLHVRKRWPDGPEEIYFDENKRAAGKKNYTLNAIAPSPDHQLLAFAESHAEQGYGGCALQFKDLRTGEVLPDRITGASDSIVWSTDNRTVFYVEYEQSTMLAKRVKAHVVGTPVHMDRVVYEEKDNSFKLKVFRTSDDRFLSILADSYATREMLFVPANRPMQAPSVFAPRREGVMYVADHIDGRWVVLTYHDAPNGRVMQVEDAKVGSWDHWTEVVPHHPDVTIERLTVFDTHFVTEELTQGQTQIHVRAWDKSVDYLVEAKGDAYVLELGHNPDTSARTLVYEYSSLATPGTVMELDLATGKETTLKMTEIGGGYDSDKYSTERIWIKARDGVAIPVTLLYKKGLKLDGSAPLFQVGYGAYEFIWRPKFDSDLLSFVDRGYVYAIAHVRGGGILGRQWYEDGKRLNKMNSFNDFIDVTEGLIERGYCSAERVAAKGASAGGLLMGAVANMRPDLYRAILARVPFVDVVTTMLDESIPFTTQDYDEWGNPNEKRFYDYMLSYSPYDNVKAQDYPAMMVTAGLFDGSVAYFIPAKWVARLRHKKTDSNPLLFHFDMDGTHSGPSGRFKSLAQKARNYAFLISQTSEK